MWTGNSWPCVGCSGSGIVKKEETERICSFRRLSNLLVGTELPTVNSGHFILYWGFLLFWVFIQYDMSGETFHENKSKRESQLKRRSIALSVSHSQNSTNQVLLIASWARWQQMKASYWCEVDSYTHFTAPWNTLWWTKQSVGKVSSKAKATPSTEKSLSCFSFFLFLYENAVRLWWTSSHCSTGTNPISCR